MMSTAAQHGHKPCWICLAATLLAVFSGPSEASVGCPGPCPGFKACPGVGSLPGPLLGVRSIADAEFPSFSSGNRSFPPGFVWGVGTSSYQIEGAYNEDGRGASIWDTFTGANTLGMPGSVCKKTPCAVNAGMRAKGATGNTAASHYRKWKQDVATMAGLGVKTYRFSVAWPRVIPTGVLADGVNQKGLDFYHRLVDALIAEGITPIMSLYHWDLPQGLLDAGYERVIPICDGSYKQGWFECTLGPDGRPIPSGLKSMISQHFVDYADLLLREFAGKVSDFYTFNEPWTFVWLGSGYGHAPGMAPYTDQSVWPYVAAHNVILAHIRAMERFRELQAGELSEALGSARMGIVLNADWVEPFEVEMQDIAAAIRSMDSQLGWFADPIWGRPDGTHDYPRTMQRLLGDKLPFFSAGEQKLLKKHRPDMFGLNHYTTNYAQACLPVGSGGQGCMYNCSCRCKPSNTQCSDGRTAPDFVNTMGAPAGASKDTVILGNVGLPQVQSTWLHPAGWGLRKLLNYIDGRYRKPPVYITENGVSLSASSPSDAQWDVQRLIYLFSYTSAAFAAIKEDGVNLEGFIVWSLMDNFEWSEGYRERFGMLFNDYNFCSDRRLEMIFGNDTKGLADCDPNAPGSSTPIYNPTDPNRSPSDRDVCGSQCLLTSIPNPSGAMGQTRHTKSSLSWLTELWETNSITDPSAYLFATAGHQCWGTGEYKGPGFTTFCSFARRQGRRRVTNH